MRKAVLVVFTSIALCVVMAWVYPQQHTGIVSAFINPAKQTVAMVYKDPNNQRYQNFENLKKQQEKHGKKLVFAMNGGMFSPAFAPVGLYVENSKTLKKLDTASGEGNFYLLPNGVFYITTQNKAVVCTTNTYKDSGQVLYATQSGPMLLIDGKVHPAFTKGSPNLKIRNGVGVLPNGKIIFSIATQPISFYDFAMYFKENGCQNALYLDGTVSNMYYPAQGLTNTNGNYGVMIAVVE
jgi:uncharacterized protein YigE (DUF2233 family)